MSIDIFSLINDRVIKRFWSKVNILDQNQCWEWIAGRGRTVTYGIFCIAPSRNNRRNIGAHRISFIIHNKCNILDNIQVCHTCDNPICVNPNHLFLGTALDNVLDKMLKGRDKYRDSGGESNINSKLKKEDVLKIRELYKKENITMQEIANNYNVKEACISKIITRRTWKDI